MIQCQAITHFPHFTALWMSNRISSNFIVTLAIQKENRAPKTFCIPSCQVEISQLSEFINKRLRANGACHLTWFALLLSKLIWNASFVQQGRETTFVLHLLWCSRVKHWRDFFVLPGRNVFIYSLDVWGAVEGRQAEQVSFSNSSSGANLIGVTALKGKTTIHHCCVLVPVQHCVLPHTSLPSNSARSFLKKRSH